MDKSPLYLWIPVGTYARTYELHELMYMYVIDSISIHNKINIENFRLPINL